MSERINRIFSDIYPHYDFFNHLFSLGIDIIWRKNAAKELLLDRDGYKILDTATGTGDLAFETARLLNKNRKHAVIYATDFNRHMLGLARSKAKRYGFKDIRFESGDSLSTRFKDNEFDALSNAFALRNLDDLDVFAREARRVLKKGGKLVLLDMARPDGAAARAFFNFYFGVMVAIGSTVSRSSYSWLIGSIKNFDKKRLARTMRRAGFSNVRVKNQLSGVAFILTAEK